MNTILFLQPLWRKHLTLVCLQGKPVLSMMRKLPPSAEASWSQVRQRASSTVVWCYIYREKIVSVCQHAKQKYSTMGSKTKQGKYHYLIQHVFWNMFWSLNSKYIFIWGQEVPGETLLFLKWIECKFSYRVYWILAAYSIRCLIVSHWSAETFFALNTFT